MSILSGYKKFKKYLKTVDGYQLISYFTSSDTVNMVDENGKITDITLTESIKNVGKGCELTKAEYDSLSEEEKKNGTIYYITDDNNILYNNAKSISFDNTNADIEATNVQDAIEEINSNVTEINSNVNKLNKQKKIGSGFSTNTQTPWSLSESIKNFNYIFVIINTDWNIYSTLIPVTRISTNMKFYYMCKGNNDYYVDGHFRFNSNTTISVDEINAEGWGSGCGNVEVYGIY